VKKHELDKFKYNSYFYVAVGQIFNVTELTTNTSARAMYSVNRTSPSNERLPAVVAVLVIGSLSNATYAKRLQEHLNVTSVSQKANPGNWF